MVKLRIEFDREGCIGAFACFSLDPARWKMVDAECKVDLVGGTKRADGKWVLEVDVGDSEKNDIVTAALSCPPAVIAVFEVESGKKLT